MSKGKPPATEPHSGPGKRQAIHTILTQFRDEASSRRDFGDRFDCSDPIICRYLELDPIPLGRFSRVWMWNEFPRKGAVGDVGMDIVAEERATGESGGANRSASGDSAVGGGGRHKWTAKGSPQGERGGVHSFCAIQCKFHLPGHTLPKEAPAN